MPLRWNVFRRGAHKKYEFGCKVSYVTTRRGNFILGAKAIERNAHDSRTLEGALAQVKELIPCHLSVEDVYVDRGYRGHKVKDVRVHIPGERRIRKKASRLRFWLRRRSAIEPVIGHIKHDGGMRRNHLLGKEGDKAHAVLVGIGFNTRKLLKVFGDDFLFFFWKFIWRNLRKYFGNNLFSYQMAA